MTGSKRLRNQRGVLSDVCEVMYSKFRDYSKVISKSCESICNKYFSNDSKYIFQRGILLAEDFDNVIRNEINGLYWNKASFMVWNGRDCLSNRNTKFKVSNHL